MFRAFTLPAMETWHDLEDQLLGSQIAEILVLEQNGRWSPRDLLLGARYYAELNGGVTDQPWPWPR